MYGTWTVAVAPAGRMPPSETLIVWSVTARPCRVAVDGHGQEVHRAEAGGDGVELQTVDRAAAGIRDDERRAGAEDAGREVEPGADVVGRLQVEARPVHGARDDRGGVRGDAGDRRRARCRGGCGRLRPRRRSGGRGGGRIRREGAAVAVVVAIAGTTLGTGGDAGSRTVDGDTGVVAQPATSTDDAMSAPSARRRSIDVDATAVATRSHGGASPRHGARDGHLGGAVHLRPRRADARRPPALELTPRRRFAPTPPRFAPTPPAGRDAVSACRDRRRHASRRVDTPRECSGRVHAAGE